MQNQSVKEVAEMYRDTESSCADCLPREYVKAGHVEIDTGTLVLVDPCRVGEVEINPEDNTPLKQVYGRDYLDGSKRCSAVIAATGIGDGKYPVFAEVVTDKKWGRRVTALHIYFHPLYCLGDDPDLKKILVELEREVLAEMPHIQGAKVHSNDFEALNILYNQCSKPGCDCKDPTKLQIHRIDTGEMPTPEELMGMLKTKLEEVGMEWRQGSKPEILEVRKKGSQEEWKKLAVPQAAEVA